MGFGTTQKSIARAFIALGLCAVCLFSMYFDNYRRRNRPQYFLLKISQRALPSAADIILSTMAILYHKFFKCQEENEIFDFLGILRGQV